MTSPSSTPPFIELKNLGRCFFSAGQKHAVLFDVSLAIQRGQSIALLGRSGSGKSTLLNLISGIDVPDQGTILLDDADLTAFDEAERTLFRRQHIGFIYQGFNLVPDLNAAENIQFMLELNGCCGAEAKTKVLSLMQELEIADKAELFPSQLSGGEQQRVAIARALIHAPALVLADEPTGNLDAQNGRQVLALLKKLLMKNNSALLLVTHSLEVAKIADRIVTLEDGILQERSGDFAW